MNRHKIKINPGIQLRIYSARIYLDYWTGNKRFEHSAFQFEVKAKRWIRIPRPGVRMPVSTAFIKATLFQHGKPQIEQRKVDLI